MDIVNYAPRIRIPVLMINGRYDSVLPHELSQLRLFESAWHAGRGQTPGACSTSATSRSRTANSRKEVNDWFDKYLGPVN